MTFYPLEANILINNVSYKVLLVSQGSRDFPPENGGRFDADDKVTIPAISEHDTIILITSEPNSGFQKKYNLEEISTNLDCWIFKRGVRLSEISEPDPS